MNWGSLLLALGIDTEVVKTGLSELVYRFVNFFPSLLYDIWRLLAWVVNGIERIFRNLAGIGTKGQDMASKIIGDPRVEAIFKNLVAFSTVMIIVFTIVKIVQEHYKEKDGGNPYKIVIRTFKGMLLFMFITSAALLGLEAAGMIFRGLDAATGGGSTSVAGQVFKTMAYDANRKRYDYQTDDSWASAIKKKYYYRVNSAEPLSDKSDGENVTDGKYIIVEMTGEPGEVSQETVHENFYENHPEYNYGIVNSDGSLTPVAKWLNTQSVTNEYTDGDFSYVPPDIEQPWKDAFASDLNKNDSDFSDGTAGYNNEFLKAFDLKIQPNINLAWSPIDIKTYMYSLDTERVKDMTIETSVLGNLVKIPMFLYYYKYRQEEGSPTEISISESAKQFGFTLSMGVGLQDGTLSAKFKFDKFDGEKFKDLLGSILSNSIYTSTMRWIIEMVPEFPAVFENPVLDIKFYKIFAGPLLKMLEAGLNKSMEDVLPKVRDEYDSIVYRDEEGNRVPSDGTGAVGEWGPQYTVTPFAVNSSVGSGVWVNVNQKGDALPVSIESYEFDLNFTELWSQLTDNWNDLTQQYENAAEETMQKGQEAIEELEKTSQKVLNQNDWLFYKQQVDTYNKNAKNYLNRLGNYLNLHEWCQRINNEANAEVYNAWLTEAGYEGTYSDLETEIKSEFVNLVQEYIDRIGLNESKKPTGSFADAIVTPSMYKPIISFNLATVAASNLSCNQIRQLLTNGKADPEWGNGVVEIPVSHKCKVNLINSTEGDYQGAFDNAYFRTIDWSAYGLGASPVFKKVGELLYTGTIMDDNPEVLINRSNDVIFIRDTKDVPTYTSGGAAEFDWKSTGISYFLEPDGSPFNKENDLSLYGDSYWGSRGISFQGTRYYQAYNGKLPTSDENNAGFGGSSSAASATAAEQTLGTAHVSSAVNNAKIQAGKLKLQNEVLNNLNVPEEKSAAANEFAKNIVTFRPLDTESQEKDKKVLQQWISTEASLSILGEHKAMMVFSDTASADFIDEMMSKTGQRVYLILSKTNREISAAEGNYGSYRGVMSYSDKATVEALYEFSSMNYVVGFIAIISAIGVYLNFAIGLIQRAVNLAVIYIMSPIAISFFPFDNGSKFKSQFVEPFYKEAISAFAVIVSLNLFIVLIEEVQKMVNAVAPGLGWLGLVAFTSMLPNIRDMLAGVMGAGKMQSKGIGSAIDGAMGSLGEGFSGLKSKTVANAGKGIAKGLGTVGKLADRMGVFGADARAKRKARLEELQKEGKLGWWGERQLNKMNKKEAKENRIKEALKSGDDSKLSKGEKRRLNNIKEAAANEAAKGIDRKNYKTDAEYQAALAAKTSELAQDKKFQKSVNGVAKFGKDLKNSELGLWAQKHFGKGSLIGEAARMVFGHDGALAKNQNSVLGSFIRLGDPIARQKSRSQIAAEARLREEQMRKPEATMLSGMRPAAQNINDGQKIAEKAAREEYAEQKVEEQLKAAGVARNNTGLKALLAAKYRQEDPKLSAVDAENKASAEMNAMLNSGKDLAAVYAEMGGDKALVMGIAKGMKAFEGLSFTNNIDMNGEVARQSIRQIAAKNANESKNLETTNKLLKDEQAKRDNALDTIVNSTGKNLGIENDAAKMAKYRQILDKAGENDQFEDIVARVIDATGADENLVKASLSSQYNNFTSEVQFNSKVRRLQAEKAKHEAFAKAKTIVQGKVGDSIPEENLMEMIQDFANVDDADMNSLNVNSLGFKKRQIMVKFDSGELVDENGIKVTTEADRDAMIERLRVKMTNEVGDKFKNFAADFTEDVRKFEGQKSFREEMMTTGTLPVMESFLDQYKFHLTTNVDPSSFQLITNDGLLKELREKGDYATRGQILEMATNAAERMDYDALAKTGLDAETQEKLIQMAKEGKTKALKGLHDLGVMENSSMGSIFANMGGDSLVQAQTSFARVLGLVEANQAISKYNTQLGSLKNQESVARDQIRAVREEIPNLLSNPKFASIMGDIVDAQGNHVKTMEEMVKVVQANLDAANSGKSVNTSYIKATIDALNNLKKGNENDIDLINAINRMTGAGFAACTRANNYVLDIETVQALQSAETAYIQEATNKIGKGFTKVGS